MGAGRVSMIRKWGEDYLRTSESFRSPDPYVASDWSVLGTGAARDLETVRSTKVERLGRWDPMRVHYPTLKLLKPYTQSRPFPTKVASLVAQEACEKGSTPLRYDSQLSYTPRSLTPLSLSYGCCD